jgi:hypothetical protein
LPPFAGKAKAAGAGLVGDGDAVGVVTEPASNTAQSNDGVAATTAGDASAKSAVATSVTMRINRVNSFRIMLPPCQQGGGSHRTANSQP